jgi:hypothetical protein
LGLTFVRSQLVAAALVAAAIAAPAPNARAAGRPVSVTLREFAIVLPAKLRPGLTTFVLHNRGGFPHNFTALYGPVRFHGGTVAPGAMTRLTVRLVPGAYLVACTILNGGHLAQGMLARFTIGSRAHGSAVWHYP